ncbi:RWD domain-containing protein [Whalleya microplaca]|nr:RWD domain-containing protein [Whalleya microplaca]
MEDVREVEISTISAIYPELQIDEDDPHTVSIELPVSLATPLTVLFPAASQAVPQVAPPQGLVPAVPAVDSQALSNLPALQVRITLPDGYPHEKPPRVTITTSPPWLSDKILRKLEGNVVRLWEEMGRDQVIFTYIDDLQRSAEDVFGLVDDEGFLAVGPEYKIAVLDYDMRAKRRAFEKGTFDCGICLDPKKGTVCHRMIECGHVFCIECLQDFYNNAITEGDVTTVTCLEPNCSKERGEALKRAGKKRKQTFFISPSELLQIPLDEDMVKRYVTLKHKTELESDKDTVYCPRSWCQGAARSKKHKKPEGLTFVEVSEEESDAEDIVGSSNDKAGKKKEDKDRLAICEDCHFAFCSVCGQSWHGDLVYCVPKERRNEITEEEQATLKYLELYSTPCPTCAAPCQKEYGCNHMRCYRCQTHFCYLCSAWLSSDNPYQHFNVQPSGEKNACYMRLWELEAGDGLDVGLGRREADVALRAANVIPVQNEQPPEMVAAAADDDSDGNDSEADPEEVAEGPRPQAGLGPDQIQPPGGQPNERVAIAREGPLVLRIQGDAPRARGRGAARRQPGPAIVPQAEVAAVNIGERGGRGNRRGRGPGINRQNNHNRPQEQRQEVNNNGRNGQIRMRHGGMRRREDQLDGQLDGQLDAVQEAWVRQFVQLALHDQEDLVAWDSDDD